MSTLDVETGDTITMQPVEWLWPNHFAIGKPGIISAPAGSGKTMVMCSIAASVTTGGAWPDGAQAPLGRVVIVNGDDDKGDTLAPRLKAAGADMSRVTLISRVTDDKGRPRPFRIDRADDLTLLGEVVEAFPKDGGAVLIVLDPMNALLGRETDLHRANVMYPICLNLRFFSLKHHAAVVIVGHPRKASEESTWTNLDELMGSGAIAAAVRSVFAMKQVSEKGRLFACVKLSNGKRPSVRKFQIVDSTLVIGDQDPIGWVQWGDEVEEAAAPDASPGKKFQAMQLVRNILEPIAPCRVLRSVLDDAAEQHGLSSATLDRALKALPVKWEKRKVDGKVEWWWVGKAPVYPAGGDVVDGGGGEGVEGEGTTSPPSTPAKALKTKPSTFASPKP